MVWDDGCPAIWMQKEHVASALPDEIETCFFQNPGKLHCT